MIPKQSQTNNGATLGFEQTLWDTANQLRDPIILKPISCRSGSVMSTSYQGTGPERLLSRSQDPKESNLRCT